jgi:hypothetical protein
MHLESDDWLVGGTSGNSGVQGGRHIGIIRLGGSMPRGPLGEPGTLQLAPKRPTNGSRIRQAKFARFLSTRASLCAKDFFCGAPYS